MTFLHSPKTTRWFTSSLAMFSLVSLLATGMTVLSASTTQAETIAPNATLLGQQQPTRPTTPTRLPARVRRIVLQTHARQYNVPINRLRVVSASRETWSDTCLGLGRPEEGCGAMMVDGWRVEVGNGADRWFYRTDNTGRSLRQEGIDNIGSLPRAVGQKVLAIASRELGIPISQLRIVAGRPQLWDGCLGVAGPNDACTMIGIPGWQVIVAGPQQYWVYHLNRQATLVKRNPTTSGRGTMVPTFWKPDPGMIPTNANDIILQSITRGGIAGQAYRTVLRRDGQVLRINLHQTTSTPILIRQLTPEQVQGFVQTLQQNELEDFMGFNYAATGGADYFTIALIAPGRQQGIQYDDSVETQTPAKFQQIVQVWQRITSPVRP